jgi:ATP-dependent DNA helicase RecG
LSKEPLPKAEIANQLNLNTITGAFNRAVSSMLEDGLIEYTLPEKPNSRLQKYRLTEKGRECIERGTSGS